MGFIKNKEFENGVIAEYWNISGVVINKDSIIVGFNVYLDKEARDNGKKPVTGYNLSIDGDFPPIQVSIISRDDIWATIYTALVGTHPEFTDAVTVLEAEVNIPQEQPSDPIETPVETPVEEQPPIIENPQDPV